MLIQGVQANQTFNALTEEKIRAIEELGLPDEEVKKLIESTKNNTVPPLISESDVERWKKEGLTEEAIHKILLIIGSGRLPDYNPEVAKKFHSNSDKLPTPTVTPSPVSKTYFPPELHTINASILFIVAFILLVIYKIRQK